MLQELLDFDHYQDPHAIAKLYFNSRRHETFPNHIRRILDGIGEGSEYNGCWFPEDVDNGEIPFTGVKFTRLEEDLIVTEREFLNLTKEASLAFLKIYPDRSGEITPMLQELEERLTRLP